MRSPTLLKIEFSIRLVSDGVHLCFDVEESSLSLQAKAPYLVHWKTIVLISQTILFTLSSECRGKERQFSMLAFDLRCNLQNGGLQLRDLKELPDFQQTNGLLLLSPKMGNWRQDTS